jgi:hypothetical protein
MTDRWDEANACAPITVSVYGTNDTELVCWVCVMPWPCDAYRAGRPNAVQSRRPDPEAPHA